MNAAHRIAHAPMTKVNSDPIPVTEIDKGMVLTDDIGVIQFYEVHDVEHVGDVDGVDIYDVTGVDEFGDRYFVQLAAINTVTRHYFI